MPSITEPLNTNSYTLKNRIVLPPMQMEYATEDGEVTDKLLAHYSVRAGNIGLCIVEHSYISVQGRLSKKQLGIHHDGLIDGLSKLAQTFKKRDAVAIIQINHAGSRTSSDVCLERPVGPSEIMLPGGAELPRELTTDEIDVIVEDFAKAAARAKKAEFDGIEIHGAHGILLNQFISPLTNLRTDDYGGSFTNRIRLPVDVVKAVRSAIGPDMLLLYRLGVDDRLAGGNDLSEGVKIAKTLAKEVDILDISGGLCGSRPADIQNEPGFFTYMSKAVKQEVDIPVIGVGGIKTKLQAEEAISKGTADMIAVGRTLLKDPDWVTNNWY